MTHYSILVWCAFGKSIEWKSHLVHRGHCFAVTALVAAIVYLVIVEHFCQHWTPFVILLNPMIYYFVMFDGMNAVFYDMGSVNPVRMMAPDRLRVQLRRRNACCVSVEYQITNHDKEWYKIEEMEKSTNRQIEKWIRRVTNIQNTNTETENEEQENEKHQKIHRHEVLSINYLMDFNFRHMIMSSGNNARNSRINVHHYSHWNEKGAHCTEDDIALILIVSAFIMLFGTPMIIPEIIYREFCTSIYIKQPFNLIRCKQIRANGME